MKRYYYAKEITCPVCEGMGIIQLEENAPEVEGNVDHKSYETVNDVIAETWGIIEYSGNHSIFNKPHYEFITEEWVYQYNILPYRRVKESDKKLINEPIIFEGEVCYVICKDVRRRG